MVRHDTVWSQYWERNPITESDSTEADIRSKNKTSNNWYHWNRCGVSIYTQWLSNRSRSLEVRKESVNYFQCQRILIIYKQLHPYMAFKESIVICYVEISLCKGYVFWMNITEFRTIVFMQQCQVWAHLNISANQQ